MVRARQEDSFWRVSLEKLEEETLPTGGVSKLPVGRTDLVPAQGNVVGPVVRMSKAEAAYNRRQTSWQEIQRWARRVPVKG